MKRDRFKFELLYTAHKHEGGTAGERTFDGLSVWRAAVSSAMGTSSSKTDRRIPSVPHFVGEHVAFACCCKDRRTMEVEEKRQRQTTENTKAEEDLIFLLAYKHTKPRSCCAKIGFGLQYFFCELCPTICCPPCPTAIIHKLAFRPPERPTYDITQFGDENEYRIHLRSAASEFLRLRYRRSQAYLAQMRCFLIRKNCPRLACLYAHNLTPNPETAPLTLIYSHNNGIDLGLCVGYVVMMARRFRANVFAYDYTGYGRSKGQCSEDDLYRSAIAAYDFVTQDLAVPPDQVVVVGTSLGTAATIHLATKRQVKGVILQGGFLSALRIVCPNRGRTCQMDRFVNIHKIEQVKSPTLVIHGMNDKLFSVSHAKMLRELCPGAKNIEPMLIDDCGHLDFDDFPSYWQRIHKFLHTELTEGDPNNICCTYHPSEVLLRQNMRAKAALKVKK